MPDPFATRLSLFTGKGGVGKSTLVAALALEAARRGRRPLVVELGHRASMQAVFHVPSVGHDPVEVAPGVHASNVDLDRALLDYVRDHVPVRALAHRIAKSESLARFFEAAPAVGEVLTVQRFEQLLEGPWDPVLVDFDATGHALMFLELSRVFEGLVPAGPVRRLLDSFTSLLSDPAQTRLHLVTLPARLPVRETLELHGRLTREHTIEVGALYVNQVAGPPAASLERVERAIAAVPPNHPAQADLRLLRRRGRSHARAQALLEELRAMGLHTVELPLLDGPMSLAALAELGWIAAGADA